MYNDQDREVVSKDVKTRLRPRYWIFHHRRPRDPEYPHRRIFTELHAAVKMRLIQCQHHQSFYT